MRAGASKPGDDPLPIDAEELAVLGGLFAAALAAATLVPAQSEAVLAGLILSGAYPPVLLIAIASAGNVLGSIVNWALGRGLARLDGRRWFPASPAMLARATRWYRRYGRWSLLLSWLPIVGDPLTLAAGVLREPFWSFLALVSVAKTARYVVLAMATLGWM
jgi:membrane protein YqaA with SNARE-associated domain